MRNTFRSLHRKSQLTTYLGARSPGRREGSATWRCLSLRTRTWPSAAPMGFSRRMRVWGEKFIMEFFGKKIHRQHHFSFRGLFVIDKSGTLRQITINDLPVGRDVDETLRLVQVILIYLEIPKRRIFTNNLKEKNSITMFYLMISSRLSSSLMNMVRFALLAGGLVSYQLILCSNNDHLPFCFFCLFFFGETSLWGKLKKFSH